MFAKPKSGQIRKPERSYSRQIAERIAACVAVCRSIGHGADSNAVKNNPDNPLEMGTHSGCPSINRNFNGDNSLGFSVGYGSRIRLLRKRAGKLIFQSGRAFTRKVHKGGMRTKSGRAKGRTGEEP